MFRSHQDIDKLLQQCMLLFNAVMFVFEDKTVCINVSRDTSDNIKFSWVREMCQNVKLTPGIWVKMFCREF